MTSYPVSLNIATPQQLLVTAPLDGDGGGGGGAIGHMCL